MNNIWRKRKKGDKAERIQPARWGELTDLPQDLDEASAVLRAAAKEVLGDYDRLYLRLKIRERDAGRTGRWEYYPPLKRKRK